MRQETKTVADHFLFVSSDRRCIACWGNNEKKPKLRFVANNFLLNNLDLLRYKGGQKQRVKMRDSQQSGQSREQRGQGRSTSPGMDWARLRATRPLFHPL